MIVIWILVAIFIALAIALHVHNYKTAELLIAENSTMKRSMSYFIGHTWVNEEGELLRVSAQQLPDKSYQVKVEYAPADPDIEDATKNASSQR